MERDPAQRSHLCLHDLFEAIDIREKGIEKIYHFLLMNKTIDDPKSIVASTNLGLKRIYKIFGVLKELGLVKIIDRPMKISINPPIPAWEMIISTKIKEMQEELNYKINVCENSFQKVIDTFNLKDEIPPTPPVEYISTMVEDDPIEFFNTLYTSNQELMVAKGLVVNNPHLKLIQEIFVSHKTLDSLGYDDLNEYIQQFSKIFTHENTKILISEEYVDNIVQSMKLFDISRKMDEKIGQALNFEVEIRVHSQSFSDFIIKDHRELLQYSVDPSNTLLGLFISRQDEITQIFKKTFEKMYQNSIDFYDFFQEKYQREPKKIDIFGSTFL